MTNASTLDDRCEVLVIGGGPAGSTAATLCAQAGRKTQLVEREHFPRFHIGESLIPETFWVLQRSGMLEKLRKSAFVKKYSVQFVSESGRLSEPFYFNEHDPRECSQTWQVLRSEFDHMLLENAREKGAKAFEGVRVTDVLMEGDKALGARVQFEDGTRKDVLADVVIDASGQSSLIQSKLKLRINDPVLNKAALWTYFEGAYRDAGHDEGATMVLQTKGKKGWFWYIPLHNNIVSVGVVAAIDYLFGKERGTNHEAIYNEELDRCPEAKRRVSIGKQVAPFHATKDYSYRSKRVAGDGWVLIGDAFGFLDPLYSSGVLLALKSAQLAADAVIGGLEAGDLSAARLGAWGPEFTKGMDRMRRLVCEYYDGFSFGKFVKRHPNLKGRITDLLIGNLFIDEVDEVVEPMNALRAELEQARATATT